MNKKQKALKEIEKLILEYKKETQSFVETCYMSSSYCRNYGIALGLQMAYDILTATKSKKNEPES